MHLTFMLSHGRVFRGALVFRIVICLAPLCCLTTQVFGQAERACAQPGVVVAQSRDSAPIGEFRIRSYRLENRDDKTFCLSVKLDNAIHAPYLIWINDNPRAAYQLRKGDEVTAVVPLAWLDQDAQISVSKPSALYVVSSFQERLKLPESITRLQNEQPPQLMHISAIRRVYRYAGFKPKIFVEIEITKNSPFNPTVANNTWVVQIGKTEFDAGVTNDINRLSSIMSEEAFAKLKDGDLVRVSWGFGAMAYGLAGKSFAKLDKTILQRAITQGVVLTDLPEQIDPNPRYLFYLHGYIVESQNTRPVHPEFGPYEYAQILNTFKESGFVVISEARKKDRN